MKNLQKKQHRQIGAQKQTVNKKQKKTTWTEKNGLTELELDWIGTDRKTRQTEKHTDTHTAT